MKIALIHNAKFPVAAYGGTERVVWWLAKGLSELGHHVVLVAAPGSTCPYAREVRVGDFASSHRPYEAGVDIEHHFAPPPHAPEKPYLVTVGGNGKPGEKFLINTVFVSRDHAERHGATAFVYNGVDPDEYVFRETKQNYLSFLAKATWSVKNVRGATQVARRAGVPLKIMGGSRWWLPSFRGITWLGMVEGKTKREVLASSRGLIFPVIWHEPFGIAVVESLVSGSPVIASPFGSLPDLVHPEVGVLAGSLTEMVAAVPELSKFKPSRCREYALERFHYRKNAESYMKLYEKVLEGGTLNPRDPLAVDPAGPLSLGD